MLFGSSRFQDYLRMSNIKQYKYDWIWEKNQPSGIAIAKYQPMRNHENILIFGNGKTIYNKQPTDSLIKDRKLGGSNGKFSAKKQEITGLQPIKKEQS